LIGWALCNGDNGTPDLSNRFILGVGSLHDINTEGGEKSVVLNVSQIPSHSHKIN